VSQKHVPAVDGYNMWPYIVGTLPASPRTEIMLDSECYQPGHCVNGSAGKKNPCDPEYVPAALCDTLYVSVMSVVLDPALNSAVLWFQSKV
jgi:hypothetical protein